MARKPQAQQPNKPAVAEETAAPTPTPAAKGPKRTEHAGARAEVESHGRCQGLLDDQDAVVVRAGFDLGQEYELGHEEDPFDGW